MLCAFWTDNTPLREAEKLVFRQDDIVCNHTFTEFWTVSHEVEKLDFERSQILKALQRTDGNITRAAELLGMGRNRLARKSPS